METNCTALLVVYMQMGILCRLSQLGASIVKKVTEAIHKSFFSSENLMGRALQTTVRNGLYTVYL